MAMKLVVFDLDGVLVEGISSWVAVHDGMGTDNEEGYIKYMEGAIDDNTFMEMDIQRWFQKGLTSIDEVEGILDGVKIMTGAEETVSWFIERGYTPAVISGGIDILVERVCRDLGIRIWRANGLEVFEDGRLTGKGLLRVPLMNKGAVLSEILSTLPEKDRFVVSIGDSYVDINLFELSDLSIAFNSRGREVTDAADHSVESDDLRDVLRFIPDN